MAIVAYLAADLSARITALFQGSGIGLPLKGSGTTCNHESLRSPPKGYVQGQVTPSGSGSTYVRRVPLFRYAPPDWPSLAAKSVSFATVFMLRAVPVRPLGSRRRVLAIPSG